jgi:CheY-like chemotaxis protein
MRAKSLVGQILKFSRQGTSAMVPISLTPLVKESIKLIKSTLPSTIEIREHITADPDTIMADATQIHQVVMNLYTNAFHAMRDTGGTLSISLENCHIDKQKIAYTSDMPPGEYLKLTVTDTGHGISNRDLDRIFEPYFTTKEIEHGTGLGLSVSIGIVKIHGGLIKVEETSSKGTTFAVYLPESDQLQVPTADWTTALPAGNQERILIVDDEQFFREILQAHLEALGYRVSSFETSQAALDGFRENPNGFDLVITDQTMPGMTGVQLTSAIRKNNSDVPIILCTGYSETVTEQTAQHYGITKFLTKPLSRLELAISVHEVLPKKL